MTNRYPFTRSAALADRLLARYGGPATLTRVTLSTGGDPWDVGGKTEETFNVTICVTGASAELRTGLQANSRAGLMAVSAEVTPELSDTLVIDGQAVSLIELRPIAPAPDGPVIAWAWTGSA